MPCLLNGKVEFSSSVFAKNTWRITNNIADASVLAQAMWDKPRKIRLVLLKLAFYLEKLTSCFGSCLFGEDSGAGK